MKDKLYFIKTNPVSAKINLYNKLCCEETSILPFMEDDKATSLEIIKRKATDNVESLSKEEFTCIFNWFNDRYGSDYEELKAQLFIHGIDIFYEISNPLGIENFSKILSDYEGYLDTRFSFLMHSESFNHFLIYGIFFTGMANGEEKYLFDFLKQDHKVLYALAEKGYDEKRFGLELQPEMYQHFSDLYDSTKFYKGSLIML
ncbi:hypothetical protein [Chryseobacterium salviniae]|uniref:Uncharacterized protein n=1 Tax=Chryseobacterium salviniae TaxID=3101750 RepID=A0ABU6HU87_9FLAO|nr:hypothetical protein [Chryseobacterium sp. T9W2-O]MEC3876631.1 hypothetical protein [Chryseobacterium sp. T9W2-O]